MRRMTEANITAAFAGESQAHMKYLIFADRAEKEHPNLARLFRAIAYAEQVHATNHLRALGGIKSNEENLGAAIDGENFEIGEMYPAYDAVAKLQEEKVAEKSIFYALEAEKIHARLYVEARESLAGGKDFEAADIHICAICGHTVVGGAPDKCPICNAAGKSYHKF